MGARDAVLGAESRFFMGRVMPRDFLGSIDEYLVRAAPEQRAGMIDAIQARAKELAEVDADLAVDAAGTGAVALGAVVLASFETLLPLFDGDERRTILLLQHAMGPVLRRPYELVFERLGRKDHPLDAIQKACSGNKGMYGAGLGHRLPAATVRPLEMTVHRCLWRDLFTRHDVPLVNTVLCAWDTNWMRAIDPAVSGLRAERTELLSLGDGRCRFAVEETDDPLHGYTDALDRRFVEAPERDARQDASQP
ncbi:MAG: L-2-amino-thiazoline-4-carboxylic acid hydrolase [Pseudonocardia sp.]|nr:L-2-amino-thiazoline-4-carboxylic acid hydrolase [Pseudonocardia sp.]